MNKVAFIGLGKLGLPVAEAMASAGHQVMGYDIEERETENVVFCSSLESAVDGAEFIFIAVPTPHDTEYDGRVPSSHLPTRDFDYTMVEDVLRKLRPLLVPSEHQTVVIISTCLPGTTEERFARHIPSGTRLIYNPYFIAMGTVADDFMDPEFMLIGSEDGTKGEELVDFYSTMLDLDRERYRFLTWNEAECTKVFYNTWISWKLSFVNMIQDVAESIGNMDVDQVTESLVLGDRRLISSRYMTAGMGDGGPCHPRDNIALSDLADKCGLGYDLFHSIMAAREEQALNMARDIERRWVHYTGGKNVVIIGKSFKPGVPFVDGSYSLLVAHYLEGLGCTVNFHDPLTGDSFLRGDNKHVFLLGHPDTYGVKFVEGDIVFDPWRMNLELPDGVEHVKYGNTRL